MSGSREPVRCAEVEETLHDVEGDLLEASRRSGSLSSLAVFASGEVEAARRALQAAEGVNVVSLVRAITAVEVEAEATHRAVEGLRSRLERLPIRLERS